MNVKDRERLVRLKDLLHDVPFPHDGSGVPSADTKGMMMYSADMREFIPAVGAVLLGMAWQGLDGMDEGYDYYDPDRVMDSIEAWLAQRKTADWKRPIPSLDYEYVPESEAA